LSEQIANQAVMMIEKFDTIEFETNGIFGRCIVPGITI